MSKFLVISEPSTRARHRQPCGLEPTKDSDQALLTFLEARSLADAVTEAAAGERHRKRRIIAVEELHPGFSYNDRQLAVALAAPRSFTDENTGRTFIAPTFLPQDFETSTRPLVLERDIAEMVEDLVEMLRETSLVPGLSISVLNGTPAEAFVMLEIFDHTRNHYRSRPYAIAELTTSPDAVGWKGVLALVRGLILHSNDLH